MNSAILLADYFSRVVNYADRQHLSSPLMYSVMTPRERCLLSVVIRNASHVHPPFTINDDTASSCDFSLCSDGHGSDDTTDRRPARTGHDPAIPADHTRDPGITERPGASF